MLFTKMTAAVNFIASLKDRPNENPNGMTSEAVKAEFDKGATLLKSFINTHITELEAFLTAATAAANIGARRLVNGTMQDSTVQAELTDHAQRIAVIEGEDHTIPDGAVTSEKIAANAVSMAYSGTLAAEDWVGSGEEHNEAPYTAEATTSGILATDDPILDLVPSSAYETALAEETAWGLIYRAVAGDGAITFYAKEAPAAALSFKARCIRK